ncbi:MAG: CDP-diacylglycerol--glycerol-3-phosphate 3-phosphatidyltransferase [Clostridiales bacterium]|jgi:CDP-diacylglycerol--glycerol-3-phosphate 3-phosphatidyltransferase|nr:CDP-diacylglycerol--glycerol-3-phosphate 3-phosphatidyltransferase [Clostridiales bacterium]
MNLPNKLTILRIILVPFFMFFLLFPVFGDTISRIVAAVIFALTALTDLLDGKIARKYNLITDFGKFLDPLADKVMIISAFISLMVIDRAETGLVIALAITTSITVFRELAVSGLRLIVSSKANVVVAAAWLGKVKTVTQVVAVFVLLLEPVLLPFTNPYVSYILLAATTVMTLWSGADYFRAYWKHIDPSK